MQSDINTTKCIKAKFFIYMGGGFLSLARHIGLQITLIRINYPSAEFDQSMRGLKNMSDHFNIPEHRLKELLLSLGNIRVEPDGVCKLINTEQKSIKQTEKQLNALLVMLTLE